MNTAEKWHGTTIVLLRKDGETVVAGDGQVSLGNTVLKSKAKKVRKIESRGVIAGFAGSTADALTLFGVSMLVFVSVKALLLIGQIKHKHSKLSI